MTAVGNDEDERKPSIHEQLRQHMRASIRRQTDPESIKQVLMRVDAVNRRAGFMAWDREKLAANPMGDPGPKYPRLRPLAPGAARLFISYSWSRDTTYETYESDLWVDAFAGFLFGRGYDMVFDRDPRNFGKGLNWFQVLVRMNDCNIFVPLIDKAYVERISDAKGVGPLVAEWKHATKFYPSRLAFIGIWREGDTLPPPLTAENTIDVRDTPGRNPVESAPWADAIAKMFPEAAPGKSAVPLIQGPALPPDPPDWPKYVPY